MLSWLGSVGRFSHRTCQMQGGRTCHGDSHAGIGERWGEGERERRTGRQGSSLVPRPRPGNEASREGDVKHD